MLPPEVLARRAALPTKPDAPTLVGPRVTLRPLALAADLPTLFALSNGSAIEDPFPHAAYDADALVWHWMSAGPFPDAAALGTWLAAAAANPDACSLTIVVANTPVGIAQLLANQPAHLKLELGNIWISPCVQRQGVLREATALMVAHAFALGYRRVEWKCDAQNVRSRAAALAYGFTYEGTQDAHYIVKGRNRDTAWFRVLAADAATTRS